MVLWCYTIRGGLLLHIFLKKLTTKIVSGAGRRASDLVQYDDMAFNYIIADAKGRWKQ